MTAAPSPAAFLVRHNPQGQNASAGSTDQLHYALASGCTPFKRCYLGTYMPSQLSRAHDARRRLDPCRTRPRSNRVDVQRVAVQ
eukprot:619893-Rhodomonas_salina.1